MDAAHTLAQIQDHLAPRLDTYEYAIYLYLFRHTRLVGCQEMTVPFKSARRRIPFGIGAYGHALSEHSCSQRVRSLAAKGCIEIVQVTRKGTRMRVLLPHEIPGIIPPPQAAAPRLSLEEMDFFTEPENRVAILQRENYRCFYCLHAIDATNFVIEHVLSRPAGGNGYRNVVAACFACNARKSDTAAAEFLRTLYREGALSQPELTDRMATLRHLRLGDRRPAV